MPMKILLIAPSAYLLGGVQDWLYLLTIGMRDKGHTIIVAIPNDNFHNGVLYNQYYKHIDAIYFNNKTGTSEGRINALSKLLLSHPVDLIVGVNIADIYTAYERVYHKLQKTKIVMTLHAIEGDYLGDIGQYCQLLDGVITTNKLTQKIVTELKLLEKDHIYYAPYGVRANTNLIMRDQKQELSIAWVGRFDNHQKRILDLVNILINLDQKDIAYRVSLAGDGPYKDKIELELGPWIKKNRVKMMGTLKKSELQLFYEDNNILLITSEWETGPIVAWEAMISGLVVVSSEYVGYLSEGALIHEATALLYPTGSANAAAHQLSRLADTDLRMKLSMRGQQMARSRYSLESSLNSWEKVFTTILGYENRKQKTILKYKSIAVSGRLDTLLGTRIGEFVRRCLARKGYCRDPGSEWPHSHYAHTNSKALLNYAKSLEENA
jgi:glycosyltransferase involved in cell wall biosynthesis